MEIIENLIYTKDYLTKSNLPESDFVINPYVGCPHSCKYCYACFMKRFTKHTEEWGTFIDIKQCDKPISQKRLHNKSVFLSSVTDCYNPFEKKYQITKKIIEQLVKIDCFITICTKSKLILRDLDLLKRCKALKVAMSVNTLDENFKNDMDNASSIKDRLYTLKTLYNEGIHTVLFMSPIFPYITDFKAIVAETKSYINEYWFENLNLRQNYKYEILLYIEKYYPNLYNDYIQIYIKQNRGYWDDLSIEIENYCKQNNVKYNNYFHHQNLVKNKNLEV